MLLISHAFHQKTKSIGFLIDLFAATYKIQFCYVDPYDPRGNDAFIPYLGEEFDLIVCIQVVPPPKVLKRFSRFRMVFFPMYDHSGSWGIEDWFPLRHLRIISFSTHLAQRLERWGFDVRGIQFFPSPIDTAQQGDPQKAFFWYRTEKINIGTVAKLLWDSPVKAIHIHKGMDPGQKFTPPTDEIRARFHLTESEWFPSRAELNDQIEACGLYFAPRMKEGIGMSFLEAMAMGRCVIAPDLPTMNEYIAHDETGLLYDPSRVEPLLLPDISTIQERTLAYIKAGHVQWEHEKGRILDWCKTPSAKPGSRPWFHLVLRICLHPMRVSRPWRRRAISIRFRRGEWKIQLFGWRCLGTPDKRS